MLNNLPTNHAQLGTGTTRRDAKALWLDTALADQPPATRAKVLDFALKFGVGADDSDFWVLIAAVGFLHTIIESAPQEWEGLLSGFTQTLNQWTTSNLEVLSALTNKAETDATQAELIRELSHTLRALATLMSEQKQALSKLGRTSSKPETSLKDLREVMTNRLSSLSYKIETISMTLNSSGNMRNIGRSGHSKNSRNGSGQTQWSVSLLALLLACTIGGGWLLWRGQQRNTLRLQWLLYKATRAECLAGIKPPDSQECLGL